MSSLRKFESWFFRRYQFSKFNFNYFGQASTYLNKSLLSISFYKSHKMYSRDFFAIYILFLDLNIYKPPLMLKTKLFYRGKSNSKITVMSTVLENKYNMGKLVDEVLFFIVFRNLDYRKMLFFSFLHYYRLRSINLFFNVRKLAYNLRDFKHLSLPNYILSYTFTLYWIFTFKTSNILFLRHFFFLFFSFFFLFYDDYNKELQLQ
jgi:hypothetical protein